MMFESTNDVMVRSIDGLKSPNSRLLMRGLRHNRTATNFETLSHSSTLVSYGKRVRDLPRNACPVFTAQSRKSRPGTMQMDFRRGTLAVG